VELVLGVSDREMFTNAEACDEDGSLVFCHIVRINIV
jgi:hypothetical protein